MIVSSQSKNLLELIHSCQDVFSKQPPVYARPAGTAPPASDQASSSQQTAGPSSSSASLSSTAKPPPPLPGQSPAFGAASSSSNGAPLRPPKPGQPVQNEGYGHARSASGGPPPAPYPGSSSRSSSGNFSPAVPNGGAFHPTPVLHHQQTGPYQQQQQQQPYPQRQGSMDAQYTGGYDNRRASGSQWAADQRRQSYEQHELNQQQQHQYHHSQGGPPPSHGSHPPQRPPSGSWSHDPRMQQYHNAPSPAPHGSQHPPQPHSRAATSPYPSGPSGPPRPGAPSAAPPITEPPPKQDLLDSLAHDNASGAASASQARSSDSTTPAAAAAPQRPLNPELLSLHTALHAKLSARVKTLRQTLQASNQHLLTIQSDLDNGPAAIEDESNRLKAVADVCKGRALKLESTLHQAKSRGQAISSRPQPPSSEIIITDSLLSNQLLTVVAQDLACTDTLYHLQRGLSNEEIGLERYLKWVRVVGREQFEKRGLGRKIERGLEGL